VLSLNHYGLNIGAQKEEPQYKEQGDHNWPRLVQKYSNGKMKKAIQELSNLS
jgi:hypothetical protein